MRVYINGRFLTQRITGVQRYAIEMTRALDQLIDQDEKLKQNEYILVSPKNAIQDIFLKNILVVKQGVLSGHAWEQVELPLYTKNNLLINFCNCAPLIKKNQVVTIHDAAVAAIPEAYSNLFRFWYTFMFKILGKRLSCIFTDSEFSRKELTKFFGIDKKKIQVVYCGIDHVRRIIHDDGIIEREKLKNLKYVFSVSSLNPAKNFDLILRLAQKMPNTLFIVAGGGNKTVFKDSGMDVPSNVRFIGYVSDEELLSLYEHALCFLFPSKYEGFGIPPLEASVCGCPVISSRCASMPEICGGFISYVDINNVNEIEKLVQDVKINRDIYKKKISKSSRLYRYKWIESARNYMSHIVELD